MTSGFDLHAQQVAMQQQLAAGDLAAATTTGQAILRRYPRHLATYRNLAWTALLDNQVAQAIDLLHRVLSADPEDGEVWAHLAYLSNEHDQAGPSAAYWAIAFDLCPWGVDKPLSVDVRAGYRRSNSQTAIDSGGRVRVTPAGLGHLLARGRHWRRAVDQLRPLVQAMPQRLDLKSALSGALWQAGELPTAQELAKEVTKELPYALKANLILATSGAAEAASARRKMAELDPLGDYARRWFGASVFDHLKI